MALLQDLIKKIDDQTLRQQIMAEVNKLSSQKKFGLVFENHLPECTPLYGGEIRRDSKVALKSGQVSDIYIVRSIDGDKAICEHNSDHAEAEFALDDLVAVAEFGEPIYPYLKQIDSVCNAPESDLWHTLIEADNYHALQLLEYLYAGKVDCIYIDPPYNTGARDWKYNNDYVDGSDAYRHSKWLSFMEKRLKLAKRLLNPKTGVLIVTIDEHEVHHLRTLLEEVFCDFYIQMTTDVINPKGVTQGRFSRVEEYNIFCFAPEAFVDDSDDNLLNPPEKKTTPRWKGLLRSGTDAQREDRENMFYPVLIDEQIQRIVAVGEPLPLPNCPDLDEKIDGFAVAWPIRKDGSFGRWSVGAETLRDLVQKGYVSCGKYDEKRKTWGISYISQPNQKMIEEGGIIITGRDPLTNVVSVEYASGDNRVIKTVWHRTSHDAGAYGTDIITEIIGQTNAFSFPKSLYATHDSIAAVVKNNKNALILDFFAGSGTTLHAVNLLNLEDGGSRRCILVTNNEVSETDGTSLKKDSIYPGSESWDKMGICRSVTWPRTKYSILGTHADGTPLGKNYIMSNLAYDEVDRNVKQIRLNPDTLNDKSKKDIISLLGKARIPQSAYKAGDGFVVSDKHTVSFLFDPIKCSEWIEELDGKDHITDLYMVTESTKEFKSIKAQVIETLGTMTIPSAEKTSMSDGFKANAAYFKLGFLDKASVRVGRQFREMLPTLWMKAGCFGPCPSLAGQNIPEYMILPENRMAILNDNSCFAKFAEEIGNTLEIETVYLITDSDADYRSMSKGLRVNQTYQLYRDYLDNFRINGRR